LIQNLIWSINVFTSIAEPVVDLWNTLIHQVFSLCLIQWFPKSVFIKLFNHQSLKYNKSLFPSIFVLLYYHWFVYIKEDLHLNVCFDSINLGWCCYTFNQCLFGLGLLIPFIIDWSSLYTWFFLIHIFVC